MIETDVGKDSDIYLNPILSNIRRAKELSDKNESARIVIVVSGSEIDKKEWERRFTETGCNLFNKNGSTYVFSFLEKTGAKTREGNFLGTLLAYQNLMNIAARKHISYRDNVCLVGMLFGRGERISPFTQIEGGRKPAIRVGSVCVGQGKGALDITALEEALLHFTPVVKYIEDRGFRGILDKWGDETEIASIDLTRNTIDGKQFENTDVIKFISNIEITESLAPQKDWVITDSLFNVRGILPRNKRHIIEKKIRELGVGYAEGGNIRGGVSLGPVAVSYKFLDTALYVFKREIEKEGIFFDFDPYFLMRLAFSGSKSEWEKVLAFDSQYEDLLCMIPDFYEKGEALKVEFRKRYGREISYKSFDMGDNIYWADIGQHSTMREKFMFLNQDSRLGIIARSLEDICEERDAHGNIIIASSISPDVEVRNSVIIGSIISGKGKIRESVIKNCNLDSPIANRAFAVLSVRTCGPTTLDESSGLYRSIGDTPLKLESGMRHGTLLLPDEQIDMYVSEKTDLRDRKSHYDVPIFTNKISFGEAYDRMFGVSMDELDSRRARYILAMNKGAK